MAVIITGMKMPQNCADCKLTYLDTGDDAYWGLNEYRCVIDNSTIDLHASDREYDCPLKALEQEPCEDAISRQAVLDLIEYYNSDGLGSVFYGYEEGVKFANEVNKLPSVTPQQDTVPFDLELYQAGLMDMPKGMIDVLDKIRAEIDEQYDRVHPYNISCAEGYRNGIGNH